MCECDHVRMNVCARSLSNETKRSSLKNEEKNTTLMHQRDRSVRIETRNKKWKWKRRPKYPNKQQQHQAAATHMQHADMEYSTETFSKTEYKTKNTTAFQFDQSSRTGGAIMWTSELAFPMPFCKYYSTPLFLHLHARSIAYSVAPVRMSVHLSPLCEKQVQFKRTYLMKFVFLCLQIANLSRVYCVALLLATYSFTLFQLCVCAHTKLKILRSSLEKHGATLSINRDTKWERERERTKEFPSYSRLCLCTMFIAAHISNATAYSVYTDSNCCRIDRHSTAMLICYNARTAFYYTNVHNFEKFRLQELGEYSLFLPRNVCVKPVFIYLKDYYFPCKRHMKIAWTLSTPFVATAIRHQVRKSSCS